MGFDPLYEVIGVKMDKSNFGKTGCYKSLPLYNDTCYLARTDPLANPDCTQKVGHPDLLSSVFRRSQQYVCAVFLEPADTRSPNLHHGCICRVTWVRPTFQCHRGSKCTNQILGQPGWHES